ncbi:MAG TPA: hypothetical protein VFD58_28020 [Blastocatellia bacterium]|nr:hypothetical protein [Blastocatellia bacterium]
MKPVKASEPIHEARPPHGRGIAPYHYAPEVEARRADYERLAEGLIHMMELESGGGCDGAELDPPPFWQSDPEKPLTRALHDHVYLLWGDTDWFDAEIIRRFYVELRLHNDQRRHGGEPEAKKAELRQRANPEKKRKAA